jgi:hypothetical protein
MSAYQQPIVDQSKTGMSKGLKTGLIIGGVLLLGVSVLGSGTIEADFSNSLGKLVRISKTEVDVGSAI